MTLLTGLYLIGAVLVLILGIAVGWTMRGDENHRYHTSRQRALADSDPAPPVAAVTATAERVLPQPPPAHITQHFHLTPGPSITDRMARDLAAWNDDRPQPRVIDAPSEIA